MPLTECFMDICLLWTICALTLENTEYNGRWYWLVSCWALERQHGDRGTKLVLWCCVVLMGLQNVQGSVLLERVANRRPQ